MTGEAGPSLVGTTTAVICYLCDDPAIVHGSFGLADMGLCADHLAHVEQEWRMHAGADGMYAWADRDGRWHAARQFFTSVHVDLLRAAPEVADLLARAPGGASAVVGVRLPLPCSVCGSPAVAAYEFDDRYSSAICRRHVAESERLGGRVAAVYDDQAWRPTDRAGDD